MAESTILGIAVLKWQIGPEGQIWAVSSHTVRIWPVPLVYQQLIPPSWQTTRMADSPPF